LAGHDLLDSLRHEPDDQIDDALLFPKSFSAATTLVLVPMARFPVLTVAAAIAPASRPLRHRPLESLEPLENRIARFLAHGPSVRSSRLRPVI
jgi:hypothetical protein